jgi:hypothetical protein
MAVGWLCVCEKGSTFQMYSIVFFPYNILIAWQHQHSILHRPSTLYYVLSTAPRAYVYVLVVQVYNIRAQLNILDHWSSLSQHHPCPAQLLLRPFVSFSVLCEISNGGLLMAAGEKTGYIKQDIKLVR